MNFGFVIYDEKQRCFMPAYANDAPLNRKAMGYGENRQHLVVPRGDYATLTFDESMERLKEWGIPENRIVGDEFFWTHDLRRQYPDGFVIVCNIHEGYPVRRGCVWQPVGLENKSRWAALRFAPSFKDLPKAIGLISRTGKGTFLPMLFELQRTACFETDDRHEYTYLERTERPMATLALACCQFDRMSYKPTRILGVGPLPLENAEKADIRLLVSPYSKGYPVDIKIREEIAAFNLTPLSAIPAGPAYRAA